jgi:hypothetical protein
MELKLPLSKRKIRKRRWREERKDYSKISV